MRLYRIWRSLIECTHYFSKSLFSIIVVFLLHIMAFSSTYSLKESIITDKKSLFFNDIVYENVEEYLLDIKICDVSTEYDMRFTPFDIMEKLFAQDINTITITGRNIIIQTVNDESDDEITLEIPQNTPIDLLYKHMYSFIPKEKYKININVLETIPFANVETTYKKAEWEIPLIKNGLQDITKFRKLRLTIDGKSVTVRLDIKVLADVYISKENKKKDDSLKESDFIKMNMDITSISNFENIMYDIKDNYYYTKNITNGEILRSTIIDLRHDVKKGEAVTVLIERNGVSLSLKATALESGNFGKPLSVKVINGGNLYGILRSSENGKIIEIN